MFNSLKPRGIFFNIMMNENNKFLEDTVNLSFFKYISFFITILTTIFILKYLSVSSFGIYSAIFLALNYSRYAFLIPYSASFKKIPYLRGLGKNEKEIQKIRENTFGSTFYIMLIISTITFISSFFVQFNQEIINGIRLLSVLIILQHFNFFYMNFLRIDKKFNFVGIFETILIVLRFILILFFIKPFGLNGILFSYIISYGLTTIYAFIRHDYKFNFNISTFNIQTWKLFKFGFLTAMVGIITNLIFSIDKLIIAKYLNSIELGYYAFAFFIIELITFIPNTIAVVLFPRIIEKYGQILNKSKLLNYYLIPIKIIAYFVPLLIAGMFIYVGFLSNLIFPKYIPALPVISYLLFVSFFISLRPILSVFFITINKEKCLLYVRGILLIFLIFFDYLIIKLGYGIIAIAIVTLIIMFFDFIIFFILALIYTKVNIKKIIYESIIIIFPFIYATVILFLMNLYDPEISSFYILFLLLTIKFIIFIILYSPLIFYINKKTNILVMIYNFLLNHIKNFKIIKF
jgi:O-antigen/teichoic acid export membrane protein